jgi:DNA-binding NarL/FixJ family response regulator
MMPVKVLVEASDLIVRHGIEGVLRMMPETFTLVPGTERRHTDVIVIAGDRFRGELVSELRAISAETSAPVLLVMDDISRDDLLVAVECRVFAVLPRAAVTPDRLAGAIRTIRGGGAVMPPILLGALFEQVERMLRDFTRLSGTNRLGLSRREVDVLRLLAEGFGTVDVAGKLCYSERTIKSDLTSVIRRLGVRNRAHAVAYAMRAGLI